MKISNNMNNLVNLAAGAQENIFTFTLNTNSLHQ